MHPRAKGATSARLHSRTLRVRVQRPTGRFHSRSSRPESAHTHRGAPETSPTSSLPLCRPSRKVSSRPPGGSFPKPRHCPSTYPSFSPQLCSAPSASRFPHLPLVPMPLPAGWFGGIHFAIFGLFFFEHVRNTLLGNQTQPRRSPDRSSSAAPGVSPSGDPPRSPCSPSCGLPADTLSQPPGSSSPFHTGTGCSSAKNAFRPVPPRPATPISFTRGE